MRLASPGFVEGILRVRCITTLMPRRLPMRLGASKPRACLESIRDHRNAIASSVFALACSTSALLAQSHYAVVDLGTLGGTNSQAFCINIAGNFVGTADTTNGPHAFLYRGGIMRDLNELIPANSGWVLIDARGINDTHQIVGSGMSGGQMHAFLLTPVSAPVQTDAMPTNQVLGPGAMMSMSVAMNTGDPLHYQWMFNGTNLPGETNATLMLSAMQPRMAGEYSVVVSNPAGVVANLRAGVGLLMMQQVSGSGPNLMLYGPQDGHYRFDHTPSLGSTSRWSTMTNFSLGTNPHQIPVTPDSGPMQFYRAVPEP